MNLPTIIVQESLDQISNLGKSNKISDLPTELFSPYRFLILKDLKKNEFVSFTNLKETTGIKSDGNLVSHLRYLEQKKIISVYKGFAGRYPKRFYSLTPSGNKIVEELVSGLNNYIEQFQ